MGIFKNGRRKPGVSWSGQAAGTGSEQVPNKPCKDGHRTPVIVSEDRAAGTRQMTCQSCGSNWSERL